MINIKLLFLEIMPFLFQQKEKINKKIFFRITSIKLIFLNVFRFNYCFLWYIFMF